MQYSKGKLVVPASCNVKYNREVHEYYSMAGIIIDLKTKNIEKFGRYSNNTILENTSFTNPYDYFDIKGSKIVFSSEEDHFLYTYDIETREYNKFFAKSKFIDSIYPIPSSKAFDYVYAKKYSLEEPRYQMIKICPYTNLTYRVVKHENIQPENTGLYKEDYVNPVYSVIVLDEKFNIIDEYFFNEENYHNTIVPVLNGVVIPNIKHTNSNAGIICLDLYIFS
jgi:hypothetical protein